METVTGIVIAAAVWFLCGLAEIHSRSGWLVKSNRHADEARRLAADELAEIIDSGHTRAEEREKRWYPPHDESVTAPRI